jgi:hypothetical protein
MILSFVTDASKAGAAGLKCIRLEVKPCRFLKAKQQVHILDSLP